MTVSDGIGPKDFPTVDPYFCFYEEKKSLFITRFNRLNEEILDRHTGRHLSQSVISESAVLTSFWKKSIGDIKSSEWGAEVCGLDGSILILREMLAILALRSHGNLKPDYACNSTKFQAMARSCDVLFDGDGKFLEYGSRFEGFLKRHKIIQSN